jgi:hypothetical protein
MSPLAVASSVVEAADAGQKSASAGSMPRRISTLLAACLVVCSGCRKIEPVQADPAATTASSEPAPAGARLRDPSQDSPPAPASATATATATTTAPPAFGPCRSAGHVAVTRHNLALTSLPDGRVLVIGGGLHDQGSAQPLVDAIDPVKLTVEPFAPMNVGRILPRAAALPGGQVVVAFGVSDGKNTGASIEIYNPTTKRWKLVPRPIRNEVEMPLVAALSSRKVLVAGGDLMWKGALSSESFLVDPIAGTVTPTDPLPGAGAEGGFFRRDGAAIVWAAQGNEDGVPTGKDCDLRFDPETKTWTDLKACRPYDMQVTRYPAASGRVSFFAWSGSSILRYTRGAWTAIHTFPDRTPGAELFDGLALDDHRLVGVDADTGDALICTF